MRTTTSDLRGGHWHGFESVRTLVRYVDPTLAVVELRFTLRPAIGVARLPDHCQLLLNVRGFDGFEDEQLIAATLTPHAPAGSRSTSAQPAALYTGVARIELVHPDRWWPAGMGEQALYALDASLLDADALVETYQSTFGLSCIRFREGLGFEVNGEQRPIGEIVAVDVTDESGLLPVTSESILLVRGHYGPDLLYDAADRAGILLVQTVPIDPLGEPHRELLEHVDRLAGHPSLAGWVVGHLGAAESFVRGALRRLDPTRAVYDGRRDLHAA